MFNNYVNIMKCICADLIINRFLELDTHRCWSCNWIHNIKSIKNCKKSIKLSKYEFKHSKNHNGIKYQSVSMHERLGHIWDVWAHAIDQWQLMQCLLTAYRVAVRFYWIMMQKLIIKTKLEVININKN